MCSTDVKGGARRDGIRLILCALLALSAFHVMSSFIRPNRAARGPKADHQTVGPDSTRGRSAGVMSGGT